MTATSYTDQQNYIKFLTQKAKSESCGESCGCGSGKGSEECSCCPPGLVAIYDDKGQHLGCLTPNDAELYKKNILTCQDGYVKLFKDSTGEFLGCVDEEVFADLNDNVNGGSSSDVEPLAVNIIPPTSVMAVGEVLNFYPQFTPSNTTDQEVIWLVDASGHASIDAAGVVTAISEGDVEITVKSVADQSVTASRTITVIAATS